MGMRAIEKELVKKSICGILLFYSPVELAKMTKSSISNISKELKQMVELGILKENAIIPFKKTYRLDRDYFNKNYCINDKGKMKSAEGMMET
jgi:DNA-binding transcriptional regulator GbsR (MarR family)